MVGIVGDNTAQRKIEPSIPAQQSQKVNGKRQKRFDFAKTRIIAFVRGELALAAPWMLSTTTAFRSRSRKAVGMLDKGMFVRLSLKNLNQRIGAVIVLGGMIATVGITAGGCSKSTSEIVEAPAPQNDLSYGQNDDPMGTAGSRSSILTATNSSSATEVVSEFLDVIRRGDADDDSDRLLTSGARRELARIGHKLQPLGSPSARFKVTRAENVPDSPGSALVHSYWSEPQEEPAVGNGEIQYDAPLQVVWAVQWESSAWRISGLAVQMAPGEQPLVLDFENGDAMAEYLRAGEVAEVPGDSVAR